MKLSEILAAMQEASGQGYRMLPWLRLKVNNQLSKLTSPLLNKDSKDYLKMQKRQFELAAKVATVKPGELKGDCVAAVDWKIQNTFGDYEKHLLAYLPKNQNAVGLEYGCGPGRNIAVWNPYFSRIDGVDISSQNLKNAKTYLSGILDTEKMPKLYLTEGSNCGDSMSETYDFAFSVICLQHICVWDVRQKIFQDIFRCLKPGGKFVAQMGFGQNPRGTVPYREDRFVAGITNGGSDVCVSDPMDVKKDLSEVGFANFSYDISPVPNEISSVFDNFIYFRAEKPQ